MKLLEKVYLTPVVTIVNIAFLLLSHVGLGSYYTLINEVWRRYTGVSQTLSQPPAPQTKSEGDIGMLFTPSPRKWSLMGVYRSYSHPPPSKRSLKAVYRCYSHLPSANEVWTGYTGLIHISLSQMLFEEENTVKSLYFTGVVLFTLFVLKLACKFITTIFSTMWWNLHWFTTMYKSKKDCKSNQRNRREEHWLLKNWFPHSWFHIPVSTNWRLHKYVCESDHAKFISHKFKGKKGLLILHKWSLCQGIKELLYPPMEEVYGLKRKRQRLIFCFH